VFFHVGGAPPTPPATDIDVADNALADPRRIIPRSGFDDADELVTGDAAEPRIALEELQIRSANAGHSDADAALPVTLGLRHVGESEVSWIVDDERSHREPFQRARNQAGPTSFRAETLESLTHTAEV
jgi:hypothetical protein